MSDYGRYDDRHRSHRSHRDDREPRYVETKETYVRGSAPFIVPEPPIASRTEMMRRPNREDSDLSVEEVRREFPPPTSGYSQPRYHGSSQRSYSAERGYDRRYDDYDDRRGRKPVVYAEQEIIEPRRRSLSRGQKVASGVAAAALAIGGKELWDRRQASENGRPVNRAPLQSAAAGVAGAFVGYQGAEYYDKHANKAKVKTHVVKKDRDGRVKEYYHSDEETIPPKRSKSKRRELLDGALGLAGIGAGAKAVDSHGRRRRGSDGSYDSRGRPRSPDGIAKYQGAAKAALLAGATEAFRVSRQPGGWNGEKGKRILTAAMGAGGINSAVEDGDTSKGGLLTSVIGGLAGNRLINGSRKDVDEGDDGRSVRSRSRSRSRSRKDGPSQGPNLAAIATAGLTALAGKKLLDRSRSRSRGGGGRRSRRYSSDSYDSRSPSPAYRDRKPKRSKSVTDYARKGLAAMGLSGAAADTGSRRDRDVVEETTVRSSRRGDSDDDYRSRRSRHGGSVRGYDDSVYGDSRYADSRSINGNDRRVRRQDKPGYNGRVARGEESASDSDSSLGSSTDDEKKVKKMKGKQLLTAGLAGVATIHAAHNVYQSMEKREARQKAVKEGDMSPEEAKKLKAKATLQDVASIGIAALGIKGAMSEIKEANNTRKECREMSEEKEKRHQKRMERQRAAKNGNVSRRSTEPRSSQYEIQDGPHYKDDNPYGAPFGRRADTLPAPPVGYDRRY